MQRGSKMIKKAQQGFTLIELMIVVAIIGILAAVAIPAYQDYVVKAKLSKVQSTIDPVKTALALYYQENGSFPNATIASTAPSATGNLWDSIGIKVGEVITTIAESPTITVDGATNSGSTPPTVIIVLNLDKIKANTIDGKHLDLVGTPGSTAITWSCATSTNVTDKIALKYFGCVP